MSMIQQETLSELGLQLHLFASECTEGFFAARTNWSSGQSRIRCILFFRKAWRQRSAAYAYALVQDFPYLQLEASLEHSIEQVLARLWSNGYEGQTWLTVPRGELHQHLIWRVEERLWNANQFSRNFFAEMS